MAGAKSGEYSRFLSFHGRNPDVLNSIANLSNDEVFTPPEFANRMLDTLEKAWAESNNGENIWSNPDLKFLDPFTKSGVFLREIATRLIKGLESNIPDLQARVDHILTKQVFGIATTQLTSLMARRSLYCSKKANGKHSITKKFKDQAGNIWFQPMSHTWKKGTIRELTMDESGNEVERFVDGKCKYCGASKRDFEREEGLELHAYGLIHQEDPKKWVGEIFGSEMQFDVIVGNPPYQLDDGGHGVSAAPIYQLFVQQALRLEPRFLSMVTPSRWFAGGKGLSSFRDQMLSDDRLSHLVDFVDSSFVFPGVSIRGGVSYFLWDSQHHGPAEIQTVLSEGLIAASKRHLKEPELDVFVRFSEGLAVVSKVAARSTSNAASGRAKSMRVEPSMASLVSARKPFGLSTDFTGKSQLESGDYKLLKKGGSGFVSPQTVTKGFDLVDSWKIFIGYASTGDEIPNGVLAKPFIGAPGEVCTETYLVVGPFDSKTQAENAMSYMTTKFFRFLVFLRKSSQHVTQNVYLFVPLVDFSKRWNDAELFREFAISESEVEFIESVIRPMGLGNA